MTDANHDRLLKQLQHEVNEVEKQIGRLFAAAKMNENGKPWPTGHAVKLKKMLPRSDERFHAALDALEDDLQMAKLVMRRDLAVCRKKAGVQVSAITDGAPPETTAEMTDTAEPTEASIEEAPTENVTMEDAEPVKATEATADIATEVEEANMPIPDPVPENAPVTDNSVPIKTDTNANTPQAEDTAPRQPLHLDTQPETQAKDSTADEDIAPKTADTADFSTTNDLDSLFGAPLSADAGEASAFTGADDFDFDAFSAGLEANANIDNDNISSLLPGLEDYASGSAGGAEELDFDSFFAPVANEGGVDGSIPHRDSTFDGLQDLADFNVGEFTAGGNDGADDAGNFEFDFLKD